MPTEDELYAFESQQEFDRMARGIRWTEEQRASTPDGPTSPIQPGAGVVSVRVTGDPVGTGFLYPGRFVYRNLDATTAEDLYIDGGRCLVEGLNLEDLYYGCIYEGHVAGTPLPASTAILIPEYYRNHPLVTVTAIDRPEPCVTAVCGESSAFPYGAPPEFEFFLGDSGSLRSVDYQGAIQDLQGDWSLKHFEGNVWRNGSNGLWILLPGLGGTWTLTGQQPAGESYIVVVFTSTDFTVSGGTFTFTSIAGGPTAWYGDTTITVKAAGPSSCAGSSSSKGGVIVVADSYCDAHHGLTVERKTLTGYVLISGKRFPIVLNLT